MDNDDVEVMGVDFVFTHHSVMLRHIGSTALEGMVYLDSSSFLILILRPDRVVSGKV